MARTRPEAEVTEVHAAMDRAAFLLTESGGALTPDDYTHVAETGLHHGLGDRVFAGVLHDDDRWREFELDRYRPCPPTCAAGPYRSARCRPLRQRPTIRKAVGR
ncbi:hypothetical protein AB0A71_14900 [Kitasatospora aureofaciens]|uniref:hypothetical protein n=1 Tax=Kitasatospora aureofaciens TaxID=1894 RepID=UPI0033F04146